MDYDKFLSQVSANRYNNPIRHLVKLLDSASPEMIPLSAGFPNPELFPISRATFETRDGDSIVLDGPKMIRALQYSGSPGFPDLIEWLKKLQVAVHNPKVDFDLLVTVGSQDAICKSFEMMIEPGDAVVVEEFIFAGILGVINPYKPEYIIVHADSDGMCPVSLRKQLERATKKPKFMYLNPNGNNPTGTVLSESRRHEIYKIACEYDIIILEDDAYYYLQFVSQKAPSFFELDTEGRVIRFDSFSKIISSGIRIGFVSGPKRFMDRIHLHVQSSVQHASSLSQMLTLELLQLWGLDGFLSHVKKVETFYKHRRDLIQAAAVKHLSDICQWTIPEGGMFMWIKANDVNDTWDMIMKRALDKNVMLVPGKAFMVDQSESAKSSYMRACFSVAKESDFDEAFRRLAQLIREESNAEKNNNKK